MNDQTEQIRLTTKWTKNWMDKFLDIFMDRCVDTVIATGIGPFLYFIIHKFITLQMVGHMYG